MNRTIAEKIDTIQESSKRISIKIIILDILIGCTLGIFTGRTVFIIVAQNISDYYITYSAPWYTPIIIHGVISVIILSVCLFLRILLTHQYKAQLNNVGITLKQNNAIQEKEEV